MLLSRERWYFALPPFSYAWRYPNNPRTPPNGDFFRYSTTAYSAHHSVQQLDPDIGIAAPCSSFGEIDTVDEHDEHEPSPRLRYRRATVPRPLHSQLPHFNVIHPLSIVPQPSASSTTTTILTRMCLREKTI